MSNFAVRCLRSIPPGTPGKTRLAHFLMERGLAQCDGKVQDRFGFHYKVPDTREPIAFHLTIDGVYELDTLSVILDELAPGGTFIDIGANVGVFTLPAAKRVGENGRVLAAEASPDILPYLFHNLAQNEARAVTVINSAICDTTGSVPFYRAPSEKFGMGSLGAQFNGESIDVPARTLDDVLKEHRISGVDVLKVDVEGFELAVFRGARNLLADRRPPLILFEFCDWAEARMPVAQPGDAQQFLMDHGYSICRLVDFRRSRQPFRQPMRTGATMLAAWRSDSPATA